MRRRYAHIIYLTMHITGKSCTMAVNGDGTLIAGILEINLFRQHPLAHQPPPALDHARARARARMRTCASVKTT